MLKNRKYVWLLSILTLFLAWAIFPFSRADAAPQPRQTTITSPSQLIDAVNGVRASYGLPPLTVHSALMQSAQSQADYMAATGQVTHSRPGGITYTQQLISLGFPLAGDLNAGGLRSENILSSGSPLVWNGVPPAWQDSIHMATMITASYTHIGAGISQGSNGYYYAVDCAAATGSGQMQESAAAALTSAPDSAESAVSQYIVPVVVNTAQPDGNVYHVLQYGQTLWSVAIEYGTTIKEIQALNGLGDEPVVWQGQKLLVKRGATQPAPPTSTPTQPATPTLVLPTPTTLPTLSPTIAAATPTVILDEASASNSSSSLLIGILIVAIFIGGGVAVWLIREPK